MTVSEYLRKRKAGISMSWLYPFFIRHRIHKSQQKGRCAFYSGCPMVVPCIEGRRIKQKCICMWWCQSKDKDERERSRRSRDKNEDEGSREKTGGDERHRSKEDRRRERSKDNDDIKDVDKDHKRVTKDSLHTSLLMARLHVSTEPLGLCFYFFSLFFRFVSRARLSWPSRQLVSTR